MRNIDPLELHFNHIAKDMISEYCRRLHNAIESNELDDETMAKHVAKISGIETAFREIEDIRDSLESLHAGDAPRID